MGGVHLGVMLREEKDYSAPCSISCVAHGCFDVAHMQEPNMAVKELYRTLQFLSGRFLKLAGADIVSDR